MEPRYSIEVSKDRVEVSGEISIREAFDFMNFFEQQGFNSLIFGESTLTMSRETIEKFNELKEEIKHNASEKHYEDLYELSNLQMNKILAENTLLTTQNKEITEYWKYKFNLQVEVINSLMKRLRIVNLENDPDVKKLIDDYMEIKDF